jgi:outer membrane receptor protein involved in Fe transport
LTVFSRDHSSIFIPISHSFFTFFLNDEALGDEIQQHDSRLQEGFNGQYLRPFKLSNQRALFIAGFNFHHNQIKVGLSRSAGRAPFEVVTKANANVSNTAGYIQQGVDLWRGRLHLEGGLRFDYFRFGLEDRVIP